MAKNDANTDRGSWQQAMGDAGPYVGLGLQMGLTVAFYLLAGLGLDVWLDTGPIFMLIGGGIGLAMMFIVLVRATQDLNQKAERARREAAAKRKDREQTPSDS